MSDAKQENITIQGFRGGANTDIIDILQIQVTNDDGSPANINGVTASTFKAKKSYAATDTIISITETNGIEFDENNGLITMRINVGHLSGVNLSREVQDFVYDWDWTIEGRRDRFMYGTLTIRGDV